jgi:hypothetical protein
VNKGVNFTPRGQISPLGARDEVKNCLQVVGYSIMGAFIFVYLEKENELQTRCRFNESPFRQKNGFLFSSIVDKNEFKNYE